MTFSTKSRSEVALNAPSAANTGTKSLTETMFAFAAQILCSLQTRNTSLAPVGRAIGNRSLMVLSLCIQTGNCSAHAPRYAVANVTHI